MRNTDISLFKFENPATYMEALTTQTHCMRTPPEFTFPYLFRKQNYLNMTKIVPEGMINDATRAYFETQAPYYTNSLLETAFHLFWVGALFRTFEIIGYRAKSELLKTVPKKYSPVVHIGFEAIFLATTILIGEAFIVPYEDYLGAKAMEYLFRGVGYLSKSRYSTMDYAAEVNLVTLKDKDTLRDFAMLKSVMFAKNYLSTAVMYLMNLDWNIPTNIAPEMFGNGMYLVSGPMGKVLDCKDNSYFIYKYSNFINLVQEIGLFSGALAVDSVLTGLKQVGVLKDPNTLTIDPEYKANMRANVARAMEAAENFYQRVAPRKRVVRDGSSVDHTYEHAVVPAYKKVTTGRRKNAKGDSPPEEKEITMVPVVRNPLPKLDLPNATVLEEEKLGVPGMIFAINLCKKKDAESFDYLFQNDKMTIKPLNVRSKEGEMIYELQDKRRHYSDRRLLGVVLDATTAMDAIRQSCGIVEGDKIAAKLKGCAAVAGEENWSCLVLNRYAAKHEEINSVAKKM